MKFTFYRQLESNDCGAACIRMICSFYHRYYSLSQIKKHCEMTKLGITVSDVVACCNYFGFDSLPIKCGLGGVRNLLLPAIMRVQNNHFIVLYNIRNVGKQTYYYIADPSFGKVKLNEQEFLYQWLKDSPSGIAILCVPKEDFISLDKDEDNGSLRVSIREIVSKYKAYFGKMSISLFLLVLSVIISWVFPMLFQKLVDFGISKNAVDVVWKFVIIQIVFIVSYILASNLSSILLMNINFKVSTRYLFEYIEKIIRLPMICFDSKLKTEFLERIEDQYRLQNFLSYRVISFIISFLSFLVFSFLLLYYSSKFFILFAVLSVISFIWTLLYLKKRQYLDYSRFSAQSDNRNNLQEILDGMPDIKINNAQKNRLNNWEITQNKINDISLKAIHLNYYQIMGSSFIDRIRDLIVVTICSLLIIKEQSTLGILLTVSYILGQLTYSLSQIYQFIRDFQDAIISLERLSDIQNRSDENLGGHHSLGQIKSIVLESVSFKYFQSAENFVLDNISLYLPLHKMTAIVGKSGSGKTTLAKILLGFYTPQQGKIYINDITLETIMIDKWRSKCGVVLQDGYIFSSTVSENITFGSCDVDENKVKYAARIACADEFIEQLPNQYRTKIGNAGIQLSGGQKQRLLIARAIYKDPEVFVFDEATSHLDAANERQIIDNLQNYLKGKTLIVIAHRLSTIVNADQILYLDSGRIVEHGTHTALLHKRGYYYSMIKNQLQVS